MGLRSAFQDSWVIDAGQLIPSGNYGLLRTFSLDQSASPEIKLSGGCIVRQLAQTLDLALGICGFRTASGKQPSSSPVQVLG